MFAQPLFGGAFRSVLIRYPRKYAGEAQRIPPSFTTARQYAAEYAALFRPTGYDRRPPEEKGEETMRWLRYQADGHEAYGIIEGQ